MRISAVAGATSTLHTLKLLFIPSGELDFACWGAVGLLNLLGANQMFTINVSRIDAGFDAVIAGIHKHAYDCKAELLGPLDEDAWFQICQHEWNIAHRGCGLSWSYLVKLFSSAIDRRVSMLPEHQRVRAIAIAADKGYETLEMRNEDDAINLASGCCIHGITLGCCPFGCGSL
ncbi:MULTISPECIES: hypothetical protein [Xanthomonas]|uniref:hypothetical protein n=1 Tax=Xanthomonas TaxID=338 RepID=UPI001CBA6032|nr:MULTISPECIES: hypothetical protein [Xanthomonas]